MNQFHDVIQMKTWTKKKKKNADINNPKVKEIIIKICQAADISYIQEIPLTNNDEIIRLVELQYIMYVRYFGTRSIMILATIDNNPYSINFPKYVLNQFDAISSNNFVKGKNTEIRHNSFAHNCHNLAIDLRSVINSNQNKQKSLTSFFNTLKLFPVNVTFSESLYGNNVHTNDIFDTINWEKIASSCTILEGMYYDDDVINEPQKLNCRTFIVDHVYKLGRISLKGLSKRERLDKFNNMILTKHITNSINFQISIPSKEEFNIANLIEIQNFIIKRGWRNKNAKVNGVRDIIIEPGIKLPDISGIQKDHVYYIRIEAEDLIDNNKSSLQDTDFNINENNEVNNENNTIILKMIRCEYKPGIYFLINIETNENLGIVKNVSNDYLIRNEMYKSWFTSSNAFSKMDIKEIFVSCQITSDEFGKKIYIPIMKIDS